VRSSNARRCDSKVKLSYVVCRQGEAAFGPGIAELSDVAVMIGGVKFRHGKVASSLVVSRQSEAW
jgi:hypothetical protein